MISEALISSKLIATSSNFPFAQSEVASVIQCGTDARADICAQYKCCNIEESRRNIVNKKGENYI